MSTRHQIYVLLRSAGYASTCMVVDVTYKINSFHIINNMAIYFRADKSSQLVKAFEKQGFTEGPSTTGGILLKEGQVWYQCLSSFIYSPISLFNQNLAYTVHIPIIGVKRMLPPIFILRDWVTFERKLLSLYSRIRRSKYSWNTMIFP